MPTATPAFTEWELQTWSSVSLDGEWTAQTTAAFPLADDTYVGENYYTQLRVARTDETVERTVVDEWSLWALGYTTPQPLRWSKDGRHLCFTNRPVPDGCAAFVNGSDLQRLDLSDGRVTDIVPGMGPVLSLSPEEATLAYVRHGDRGLVLRNLATGTEWLVNWDEDPQGSKGSIIWSPDGTTLVLTAAVHPRGPEEQRAHSIARVDVATLSATTLLAQDPRLLTTTGWSTPRRVLLTGSAGDRWCMDPETAQIAREGQ